MRRAPDPVQRPVRPDEQGFTLIELMIALGLFALVAVAGVAMVDGILGVQARTEVRLDRLAELQRAMLVIESDLDALADPAVTGTATAINFERSAPGQGGPRLPVAYALAGSDLGRTLGPQPQQLLTGVAGVRFRYLGQGWSDAWPATPEAEGQAPRAVEVTVTLAPGTGPQGTITRLVPLPAPPARETPPEPGIQR